MADLAVIFDAVLEDTRAHGMPLPSFVEWNELSAQDKAFLVNLVSSMLSAQQDEFAARIRRIRDLADQAWAETES